MERFHPGPDPRAEETFSAFNEQFHAFVAELPEALRPAAARRKTYTGDSEPGEFEGFSSINPIYACTPWMFWELTSAVPGNLFLSLAASGAFLSLASVVADHRLDGQVDSSPEVDRLHTALVRKARAGFMEVFPAGSEFWSEYGRLRRLHRAGLDLESRCQAAPLSFDAGAFETIAAGKVAPIAAALAAFLMHRGAPHLPEAIEKSLTLVFMAGQLFDDLLDWRQDLAAGHATFYLRESLDPAVWSGREIQPGPEPIFRTSRSRQELWALDLAKQHFESALQAVAGLPCSGWKRYIEYYHTAALEHRKRVVAARLGEVIRDLL